MRDAGDMYRDACRVILEYDQVPTLPSRRDFSGACKVNKNALRGECFSRRCGRRYGRTPPLCLYRPTASDQGTREVGALLLGRLGQKVLVGVGVAHVKYVNTHYLETSNALDEQRQQQSPGGTRGAEGGGIFPGE